MATKINHQKLNYERKHSSNISIEERNEVQRLEDKYFVDNGSAWKLRQEIRRINRANDPKSRFIDELLKKLP